MIKSLVSFLMLLCPLLTLMEVATQAQSRPKTRPPNILWISCEDLSPHFSFYGDRTINTPNLDRLSAEGVTYDNVFTTAGVCAPSRCAIITGMNQVSVGGHNMRTLSINSPEKIGLPNSYSIVPPVGVKAFPEFLRAAGYYCTNNEKTDYQFVAPPTVWDESSNTAAWRNRKPGQPFFAVVNYMITHESQVWMRKGHPLHVDPATITLPPLYPDTKTVRNDVARFYSNIADLDSLIGGLLHQLEEDHLTDSTVIFFWSDHGDGLPFFKRELYDRGIHIPLVIRHPGKAGAGTRNDQLLSSIDFAPTVLSLAGVQPPAYMQGRAFLGKFNSKKTNQYIYAARDRMDSEYDRVRAVRDKRFKYIRNFHPELPPYQKVTYRLQQDMMREILELKEKGQLDSIQMKWFASHKPPEEFYDVVKDPYELHNLAGDPAYVKDLTRMRVAMDQWLLKVNDLGAVPETEMIRKMWNGADHPPVTEKVDIAVGPKNKVTLSCATPGASLGYKIVTTGRSSSGWEVYTGPFSIQKGQSVQAIAQRIGFELAPETSLKFDQ